MTKTEHLGGTRVLSGGIEMGDFIRFGGGANPSYSEQWWRVDGIDGRIFTLTNKAGRSITWRTENWNKIYRHPYSQRRTS